MGHDCLIRKKSCVLLPSAVMSAGSTASSIVDAWGYLSAGGKKRVELTARTQIVSKQSAESEESGSTVNISEQRVK
jgi:hypothetical protein